MLKKSVILIPTIETPNQVCDFVWQTSRVLSNHGNYVYILSFEHASSLKEILSGTFNKKKFKFISTKHNINYLKPIYLIPFRRFNFITHINQLIYFLILQLILKIKHFSTKKYLHWMFFPHLGFLFKTKIFFWETTYDIIDFYTFPDSKQNKKIEQGKKILLNKSDHLFAISHSLKKYCQTLTTKKISIVPQGFSHHIFERKLEKLFIKISKNKPIIGFVGQLNERLDFQLLIKLISENQDWNFIFVGPKDLQKNLSTKKIKNLINSLLSLGGVTWVDQVPKKQIPSLINQFDVCIIPYDISHDFNHYCYPMKLFEYFILANLLFQLLLKNWS
ncbi:glycosyltransferase [Patescibacteria group bacterium]|nr:glycosyltransferase [Patescibacteria group bacterium]